MEKVNGTKAAKPAAKKAAVKKPAVIKFNLAITVETPYGYAGEECYVCGNIAALGGWDISKAKKTAVKDGKALLTIKAEAGAAVEFKVTAQKSWATVQKGGNYEELQNNAVKMDSDKECAIKVYHFNTII